ncbi:unnamed protein product, partial [Musa banksii]
MLTAADDQRFSQEQRTCLDSTCSVDGAEGPTTWAEAEETLVDSFQKVTLPASAASSFVSHLPLCTCTT